MNNLRPYLRAVFFVLAWILPLFGILVAKLNLSLGAKAVIISLLTVGSPELLGLLAVLCLGKKNLIHLKNKILAWLNRLKPAAPVSRIRYRVGLVMFLVPLVPTYIMVYAPQWLPDYSPQRLYVNLTADFFFLSSLLCRGVIFGINCWLCSCMILGWSSDRGHRKKSSISTKQLRTIR
jgi:hypothetical protein